MPRLEKWLVTKIAAALLMLIASSAVGQELTKTQIRDVLYNADGSGISGSLTIRWPSFRAADGSTVANSNVEITVIEGVLAVDLTPNEGASPNGTSYRVDYLLDGGNSFTETWVVPSSPSPVTVADIRVQSAPGTGATFSQAQVEGLTAELAMKADLEEPNTFQGQQTIRETTEGANVLGLETTNAAAGIYFRLPPLSTSTTYTLPFDDGLPNQKLTTDGAGNLFWSSSAAAVGNSAYELFQSSGVSLTQRTIANFSNGLTAFDNAGLTRTEVQPVYGTTAGTITQGNDSRLSNARTPLAHASTHSTGGSDPISPVNIGALKRTNDFMVGTSFTDPVLKIQGATGQSAALQEWRDGSGTLAALVTPSGSAFFREMGIAAPTGGTVASEFFQLDGKNRFALSATATVMDIIRYDDNGVFKDRAFRVFRSGNITTAATVEVSDPAVGSGTLKLTGDYADFKSVVAPASPSSGTVRVFVNSVTGEVSAKKSNGTIVSLEQGGGGGGGSFGVFTDAATPSGTINGTNATFTLAAAPNPLDSLQLNKNGVTQKPGTDFALSGSTITFLAGAIPQTGDQLLAWYRTSSSAAGGDLTGTFPSPTVVGLQGRTVSSTAPTASKCLAWNATASAWQPASCGAVPSQLTWHFGGTPTAGAQPMTLTLPEGLSGVTLKDARITANTTGSTATTFNIDRCVSACTGQTPNFSPIYGVNVTLGASTRTTTAGAPTSTTANAGDQFRVNLATLGTGLKDVTVTLTFEHTVSAKF